MQVQHDDFVVVVDGEKMLLLRNEGDAEYPHLEVVEQDEQESRANRELRRDTPGDRSLASAPAEAPTMKLIAVRSMRTASPLKQRRL